MKTINSFVNVVILTFIMFSLVILFGPGFSAGIEAIAQWLVKFDRIIQIASQSERLAQLYFCFLAACSMKVIYQVTK